MIELTQQAKALFPEALLPEAEEKAEFELVKQVILGLCKKFLGIYYFSAI